MLVDSGMGCCHTKILKMTERHWNEAVAEVKDAEESTSVN